MCATTGQSIQQHYVLFIILKGEINMAIWGYARVSTTQQNEDRQVVELRPLVTTESHLLVEK